MSDKRVKPFSHDEVAGLERFTTTIQQRDRVIADLLMRLRYIVELDGEAAKVATVAIQRTEETLSE